MRPTTATSGEAALALLGDRQRRFGVCLVDADMPGMGGFDVVQQLAADHPTVLRHTWMMVTAAGMGRDAARSKQLGVAGWVTKPVLQSDLLDELLRTLGAGLSGVDERDDEAGRRPSPAAPAHAHAAGPGAGGLDVLLVEDMPVNLTLATRLLERLGHRVSVARNGAEAVELTGQRGYDVVLMDMQMPVMDGLGATRAIRAREAACASPRQPIVAMTANAMAGDRERCLVAGMDGYVSKPIDSGRLATEIARVLDRPVTTTSRPGIPAAPDGLADIDIDDALERVGGDRDMLLELAQMFVEDCPERVAAIDAAVLGRDPVAAAAACHDLLGTSSNLSALALQALVKRIGAHVKAGDWARADELLVLLPIRLQAIENRLEQWARSPEGTP